MNTHRLLSAPAVLTGCLFALFLLWLPGIKYPIVSDTAFYALLGESLWEQGRYILYGEPYAAHLPFHAFVSYPFTRIFGLSLGMKVSTLLAGWAVLLATFVLLRRQFSERVALVAVTCLTGHFAFVLMTQLGSADLLFTALFLMSVYGYLEAKHDARWYVVAFVAAGLASLTRYNGVPLFGVYGVHILVYRRYDLLSGWFWSAALLGFGLWLSWPIRNWLVFDNPFHTRYTTEMTDRNVQLLPQLWRNLTYYLQPIHNILPVLFACSLYGFWQHTRKHGTLLFVCMAPLLLTAIWWLQAIRFAFPVYPIWLGFAAVGLLELLRMWHSRVVLLVAVAAIVVSQMGMLCLYTYGSCNALLDRHITAIPADIGLTPEGFYAWHQAREWVNEHVPKFSLVQVDGKPAERIWSEAGVFRPDIRVTHEAECQTYRITQHPDTEPLFTSDSAPHTSVVLNEC